MVQYYNSGYITFRQRKIGVVFSGQTAQHVMEENLKSPAAHPLKHLRIQQLARLVKEWEKTGDMRYTGTITDNETGIRFMIVVDIYSKFCNIGNSVQKIGGIMSYLEKLVKLEGAKPESLAYHQKINRIKTEELAAKSFFRVLMTDRKEKARAKKLGLI